MKAKSGIPLFIKIAIGTVLVTFIYNGLIQIGLLSPPKTPMAEAEGKQVLMMVVRSLQGHYTENLVFPENYETMRENFSLPSNYDYHSVEIRAIDNSTAVFKIVPKIADLSAFSGMVTHDRDIGYQVIICQSEQPSKSISFPDVISQCPSNTRSITEE